MAIDFERVHRDDRVYDVGRLCGELKHSFLLATGEASPGRAVYRPLPLGNMPAIFPTGPGPSPPSPPRLPFHLGLTLLRIARNGWLDDGYRRRLVREATTIFEGAS